MDIPNRVSADWVRWFQAVKQRIEETPALAAEQVTGVFGADQIPELPWTRIDKAGSSLADLTTTNAADLLVGTLRVARMPALTGDVTTGAGTVATTIGAGKVTNAMLAAAILQSLGGLAHAAGALTNNGSGGLSWAAPTSLLTANNPFGGFVSNETPAGAVNGVNAVFTPALPYAHLHVYLNGVRQQQTSDYTETTATTFTCVTAPLTGDVVTVDYRGGSVPEIVFDSFGDVIAA